MKNKDYYTVMRWFDNLLWIVAGAASVAVVWAHFAEPITIKTILADLILIGAVVQWQIARRRVFEDQ